MTNKGDDGKEVGPLLKGLNWVYDKSLQGIAKFEGAEEFARNYTDSYPSPEDAIDSLVSWQVTNAAVAGFVTGLGGVLTLAAAIPANLASVLFIQLRMIAGIAHIRGYDLKSDQVRSLAFICLTGSAAADVAKNVGIRIGTKLTEQAVSKISGATIRRINQAVGFRLATKAGTTGAVNLTKFIPFVGGLVSGAVDAAATQAVASSAKKFFPARPPSRKRPRKPGNVQGSAGGRKRASPGKPKKPKSD